MNRPFGKIVLIMIVTGISLMYNHPVDASNLSPGLAQQIADRVAGSEDGMTTVVVYLNSDKLTSSLKKTGEAVRLTRAARIKSVLGNLRSFRSVHADPVESYIESNGGSIAVRHWIVPAYTVSLPVSQLQGLSDLSGVRLIVENATVTYERPVEQIPAPELVSSISSSLSLLNVPQLWNIGLKGEGRLVCSFDTGVESSHPALASKWRGNSAALSASWFSKVAASNPPVDAVGHGTHTMGVMVGSDGNDLFGVAPEAEWISAGVIDQGRPLSTTISDIMEAFAWALNPDGDPNTTDDVPDVILNSWGLPKGLFIPCNDAFSQVIANVESAGIVTIFAAGNEGPNPSTLRHPADLATSPLNTLAVGAVGDDRVVAGFSSRGPSSCNGDIKPELVAPGVSIRSSYKGGGYNYLSGTSMAAPYVAGLVALMRQYNPDATVDEIKNALILSAEDLGDVGEDNDYGYGLVDASRVLDFLPVPSTAKISVWDKAVIGTGIAFPGEQFDLRLTLVNSSSNLQSVVGRIAETPMQGVSVISEQVTFYFNNGPHASNLIPFQLSLDDSLKHGTSIDLTLYLSGLDGVEFDTLNVELIVGMIPPGQMATHQTNGITLAVSDFGQFGFAPGSIYNTGAEGFRFGGSDNLLYEAGIIVGRNRVQLSSSVRDSIGQLRLSDFSSLAGLSGSGPDGSGRHFLEAEFNDLSSEIPIPITISQSTTSFDDGEGDGLIILKYIVKNESLERLSDMYFGFLTDFDLSGDDRLRYDTTRNMVYQTGDEGLMVGLVGLRNMTSFTGLANGSTKIGLSADDKFSLVSASGISIDTGMAGDLMFIASVGPFTLGGNNETEIGFALVAGDDLAELRANSDLASERYDLATDISSDYGNLRPGQFILKQNYPNPFNPSTNIEFVLATADVVSLDLFNLLGQRVRTLHTGLLPAGQHSFTWDGSDGTGGQVSSGIYFYRLSSKSFTLSRKMILLK